MEAEEIMVLLLGLVDMFMVANLLVMITEGSYFIFIQPFLFIEKTKKPQWLMHVDHRIAVLVEWNQIAPELHKQLKADM